MNSSVQLSPAPSVNNLLLCSLSGYVLAIIMMAIIIILGVGITLGYFYKRLVHTHGNKHTGTKHHRELGSVQNRPEREIRNEDTDKARLVRKRA